MYNVRLFIFNLVSARNHVNWYAKIYSYTMFVCIIASLFPLGFRESTPALSALEYTCVSIFIVDYLLRWATADLEEGATPKALLTYPLSAMALIDLLSILPAFTFVSNAFNLLRITRLARILRILKFIRYSKELSLFLKVLYQQRSILLSVFFLAAIYILFTALLMFNVDRSFASFFDALYWATTALTTVGYGDICPHNNIGRIISMLSSLVGVAVIALPSGVITASYLKMIEEMKRHKKH